MVVPKFAQPLRCASPILRYLFTSTLARALPGIHPPRSQKANHSLTAIPSRSRSMSSFINKVPNTMTSHKDPLVWIDCEVTCLDIWTCHGQPEKS